MPMLQTRLALNCKSQRKQFVQILGVAEQIISAYAYCVLEMAVRVVLNVLQAFPISVILYKVY